MKPSTAFVDPADNGNQVARGRAPDRITFIWTPARLSRGLPWLTVQTRYGSDLESSLIGVIEVKLLLIARVGIAPVGHSLLFAVGAGPPHDGVRKARRPNLVPRPCRLMPAGSGLSTRSSCPSSPPERSEFTRWGEVLSVAVLAAPSSLCRLLAEPELGLVAPHTMEDHGELAGDRDASAAMPRCLAIFMPQARRLDHLRLRTSSVCAAS